MTMFDFMKQFREFATLAVAAVAGLRLVRPMSITTRVMRFFLWASVLGWGIGLGAKLFDLL